MSTFATFAERFAAAIVDTLHRAGRRDSGLAEVDDRTLSDLGVSRSEIGSIEAEAHSQKRPTRRRIVAEPRHA